MAILYHLIHPLGASRELSAVVSFYGTLVLAFSTVYSVSWLPKVFITLETNLALVFSKITVALFVSYFTTGWVSAVSIFLAIIFFKIAWEMGGQNKRLMLAGVIQGALTVVAFAL